MQCFLSATFRQSFLIFFWFFASKASNQRSKHLKQSVISFCKTLMKKGSASQNIGQISTKSLFDQPCFY